MGYVPTTVNCHCFMAQDVGMVWACRDVVPVWFGVGQVENAETETELRKRKYGSEKKSRLLVAWLTNVPCRQRVTVSKRCKSQVLIHRTPASTNTVV